MPSHRDAREQGINYTEPNKNPNEKKQIKS